MTTAEGDPAPDASTPPRRRWLTRRRFLIGAASGAGLLLVGAPVALDRGRPFLAEQVLERGIGDPEIPEPMVWFELTPSGATLHVPKIEMGQGIHTALAQVALAELPLLDADSLAVVQADTRRGFAGGTMSAPEGQLRAGEGRLLLSIAGGPATCCASMPGKS